MAEALRMAKGFFPVMEFPYPVPTKLEVPLVLIEFERPLVPGPEPGDLPLS